MSTSAFDQSDEQKILAELVALRYSMDATMEDLRQINAILARMEAQMTNAHREAEADFADLRNAALRSIYSELANGFTPAPTRPMPLSNSMPPAWMQSWWFPGVAGVIAIIAGIGMAFGLTYLARTL